MRRRARKGAERPHSKKDTQAWRAMRDTQYPTSRRHGPCAIAVGREWEPDP
jgi:hypothetical protein